MSTGYPDDRYDDRRPGDAYGPPANPQAARARVGAPAVFILLNGLFGLVVAAFLLVVGVISPEITVNWMKQIAAAQPPGPNKQNLDERIEELENQLKADRTAAVVQGSVEMGAFALLNLVAIVGAVRMRAAGSYGWAMAASVVSLIPCATGFCCTGLPFGLWGLLTLLSPDVKAGFAAVAAGRANPDGY